MSIKQRNFGKVPDGRGADLFILANAGGAEAAVTNYGAAVVSLQAPAQAGALQDVVTGFSSLDGYLQDSGHFGAVVGRYGNRIGKARFALHGVEYTLDRNNGENSLHGGRRGFDKVLWTAHEVSDPQGPSLELSYLSVDGEEGYPGNLQATVRYTWTNANEWIIRYTATTDKDTIVNLTNHSYFNLAGHGEGDILGHEIMIAADRFTPIDSGLIPTGELRSVEGTPLDFRSATPIGARIDQDDEQLRYGHGYDHNFVLNQYSETPALAARVREPKSGRVLEVLTTEPGVQFYSGNFLTGAIRGKDGKRYPRRSAFCLETQHFPDSPNHPHFPSTMLRANDRYQSTTIFRFLA